RQGIPPSADGGKGSALDPPAFFTRKGWTEKPVLSLASPYRSFRPTNSDLQITTAAVLAKRTAVKLHISLL
ncbi:MAG: hypothetical protein K6F27_07190, partial [Ruminococcus sp.]|nr:hypothetical protein [Ruminococcus sp.]